MNFTHPFFPRHTFLFKGGAPAAAPAPMMSAPPTPTPLQVAAPAAPPATSSSLEVTEAGIDAKRQAKAKKGINSTILAGAESPAASALGGAGAGKNTLLGGG